MAKCDLNNSQERFSDPFWQQLSQEFAYEGVDNVQLEQQLQLTTAMWLDSFSQSSNDPMLDFSSHRTGPKPLSRQTLAGEWAQQARVEVAIATAWEIVRAQLRRFLQDPQQEPACLPLFGSHPSQPCRHLLQQLVDEVYWPELVIQPQALVRLNGGYEAQSNTLYFTSNFLRQNAKTPAVIAQVMLTGLGQFIAHQAIAIAQAA